MQKALATVVAVTLLLVGSTAIATAASRAFNSNTPASDGTLLVRENNQPILTKNYSQGLWTSTVTIQGNYEILPSPSNKGLKVRIYFNSPGQHSIDVNTNAYGH